MFHIPGEDVIILGIDDHGKSIRLYDLFVKTGPRFESKMESKTLEGNVAQIFMWFKRTKLGEFMGYYDHEDPNILHVDLTIDKREGCIFKTDDKPEGILYLFDMQTGEGAQLVRKSIVPTELFEGSSKEPEDKTKKKTIDVSVTTERIPAELAGMIIPQQIRLKRDPVIDILVSVNPYLWGSTIDSFITTELLRGKVEMWKTILIAAGALLMGLLIGMGMK